MTASWLFGTGNGTPTDIFTKDPFLPILQERTWCNLAGRSTLDSLLHQQIDKGYEQFFVFYRDTEPGCQLLGTTPFWSQYEVHNADTMESKLSARLRRMRAHDDSTLDAARDYLTSRIAGPVPTSGFEYFALWECMNLRERFTRRGAIRLAEVMEKNIFAFGITTFDRLPLKVRKGYAFPIHFHIGDRFKPPSPLDLEASLDQPLYVGAYARALNKTRIYGCYKGEQVAIVNGDLPNDRALTSKSGAVLDRPTVGLKLRFDMPVVRVECAVPLRAVHAFGLDEAGTFEHLGALSRDATGGGIWRNYQRIRFGFVVQARLARPCSRFFVYALDVNNLGAMAMIDVNGA